MKKPLYVIFLLSIFCLFVSCPDPDDDATITIPVHFDTFNNVQAALISIITDSSHNFDSIDEVYFADVDGSGDTTFSYTLSKGTYFGISVFVDSDGDYELSPGDYVWGNSQSSYSWLYWGDPASDGLSAPIDHWETAHSNGFSLFNP